MKLTVFQSDKGDCLLLTSKDSKRVLVDGGMSGSYTRHVAPALGKLRQQKRKLDLVYVSHIDEDHISGVLQLLDDMVAWRAHEFQRANGNPIHPPPQSVRPPEISAIWHNAFHEQAGQNAGAIETMLAALAAILSGAPSLQLQLTAAEHRELATSMRQAVQVSRRIGDKQLKIPLNPEFERKLMMVRDASPAFPLGRLNISILGPFPQDLAKLRRDWNKWLESAKGQSMIKAIERQAIIDEQNLGHSAEAFLAPLITQAEQLGRRSKVSVPNLASLMLLVEEDGKSVLLTGDGHWKDILKGLRHHGKLSHDGNVHVNVLKVQHHGSEHNLNSEFCKAITADHYVFCGNGAHRNPDLRVIEAIANSRLGKPSQLSRHPKAQNAFKFWFNSRADVPGDPANQKHMVEVEKLVKKLAKQSSGKLRHRFLSKSSFNLTV